MNFKKIKWVGSALVEFIINMLVSTLPFTVGVVTIMLSAKLNLDLLPALKKVTSNGELVVYSATLMAPLMYAVLKDPPVSFRVAFAISGGISVVAGVVVYVVGMLDGFTHRLFTISAIFFGCAVFVYLVLLLVQHEFEHRKSATQLRDDEVSSNLAGYKKHRGVRS
ncbi:TPA: hypothetical protein NJF72_000517 [Pseudomonas aeruginosa]|uniref:hypothetical protein n=1 Tax=Pseudomonas aeruginosa TaxID=287 RepID=UPI000F51DC13|nr:hypothetical protein [Pseudomonas aeruginosa]HCG0872025.1 hypothetical protein [Pseudomonas aeruginosa]HCI2700378.1 hypothetical protein [Pseudomonas aeruginosa]